jgi:flagellar biosynthetic protein FlhB
LAQTWFLFLPDKIAPDVARLHPGRGWQRLLEGGNGVRSLLGLVKLLTIVAVAAGTLWGDRERLLTTLALAPAPLAATLFQLLLDVGLRVALALAALAVLDYGYQFWRHEQQLWMTRQELQEEQRSEQGDPAIASRRRSLRQTLSLPPLTRRVPEADVVLVRRGALAVALRYDASQSIAPHVVAKGSGAVAAQIEQVALEHGVPIAEEPQLTRDLYRQTPLEAPILPEHYAAVARLLAQRA